MLKLENISKSFDGTSVLKGIDLEIADGETIIILGRSGSGKSVTLKLILRLLLPDEGRIFVDGEDTTEYSESQMMRIRKKIGMLFQGSALFDSMSVWENLAFPLREHTKLTLHEMDERIEELLYYVDMSGTENKSPAELSGGMKKRIALARAMIMKPKYIFYDEPTTGLDPITAMTINDLIVKTSKEHGITSVVVTHDMVSAFYVGDRFSFLHDGDIIFNGSAEEIRKSDKPAIQKFLKEAKWKKKSNE
ncbi:MAG: ABC transporter ATP-binding protein [Candidatus Zixiibacteriota bacterium]